jgi:hypothetical protein
MRRHFNKRRVALLLVVLAAVALTGFAIAQWLTSGTGPGKAKGASVPAVTFTADAAPTADLYPTGTATGTWAATASNPGGPLVLSDLHQTAPTQSSDSSNCPANNVTIPDVAGLSTPVPAGTSSIAVPNVVRMAASAPSACQGVTFTILVSATLQTP